MAITHIIFTHQPVTSSGAAALAITDPDGNPTTVDGLPDWVADSSGIVSLTIEQNLVIAEGNAVGVASVTCSAYEGAAEVSGVATVTVTSVGGKLVCAWSSGAGLTVL
jgi:hypothetical protein